MQMPQYAKAQHHCREISLRQRSNPRISLGGANELRDLSSVVTVTQQDDLDDYEKQGSAQAIRNQLKES